MRINLPNQITLIRLVLTIVFFVFLSFYSARDPSTDWILKVAFWLFVVAALSDILDGYLARSMNQITTFGRVVDPVVDKVLICGAFAFLCSDLFYDPTLGRNVSGVAPWMLALILLREFLVSAIRSFAESGGHDYSAVAVGKIKMFIQSATVVAVLGARAWFPDSLDWLITLFVWLTVVVTALSLIDYLWRAPRAMFQLSATDPPSERVS